MGSGCVAVAMSGGVDSSVAASLLVEQGIDVIGVTMRHHPHAEAAIDDARKVAVHLGIPHHVIDLSVLFDEQVVHYFVQEYLHGRTPNPCVVCNPRIKWEALLGECRALGAEAIATGHYSAIRRDASTGRWLLSRGSDDRKDQSYALWGLTQESLSRTMFPLGTQTKEETRRHATAKGIPVAAKAESFEVCFIPDNDYQRFLRERVPDLEARVGGGSLRLNGETIGAHNGYPFFTIGQRKRLGVAIGEPLYVTGIDAATNTVDLGRAPDLLARGLTAGSVNLIKYGRLAGPMRVTAKVRYKDDGAMATAWMREDGRLEVGFDHPKRAITPGQSVVLYEGDDVVGGGIIDGVVR